MTEFFKSVLGPRAVRVNCADVLPMVTTLDRELEDSVKTELPMPDKDRLVVPLTASEETLSVEVSVPDPVGVKVTEIVQL